VPVLRLALPSLAVLLLMTATSCDAEQTTDRDPASSTGPSAESSSTPYSQAVRAGVAALYAGNAPTPEEAAESGCFAGALLQRLTPAEAAAAGIVGADGAVATVLPVLDVPTAQVWVAAQRACGDFVEVSTRALGAQSKGKVGADTYAACLREAISGDAIDAALVDTLTGGFDSPEVMALAEAQAGCARAASPAE
jgi:hypothetical protein